MLFLSLSVIIFSIKLTTQAHLCQPYITEGSHSKKELGGYLYLDCDISTCENVSKVIFEKTDAHQITQWTPVFEGKDTSHNTVLDTDDDYSLKGRNDYVVFPTFHSLYITNITLKDTGWWRCVLLQNNKRTESKATDIYLAPLCTPVITEGSHSKKELRGHLYLECDISSCKRVSRVVFEKNGVQQPAQWTPVFEGIDESHYTALDTCEDYTLKQRNNYFSFPTYHLLYIGNLTMNDFGEWRCVSNQNHRRAESKHIRIVMIDGSHVTITHANPFVVAKQDETFTCTIDEIHTEPIFEWTVTSLSSSEKYYGETIISKQRDDGLWYASNVVKLKLNNHGQPALKCSLVTKNKVPLMETQLTVDIKAPAKITDPTEEQLISKNVSSTLTLRCGGSGYRPLITWQQNGLDIQDKNPQFHLTRSCSTSFCTSTLTLKPIAPPLSCDNVVANSLEYTCTVILKPPYTSNDTSKPIKVEIMYPPLIKDSSKDDDTIDSLTVILRCEVCSSTNSTSEWTYNGKILQGDNIEYQQDGSVKLIGNHPSGTYTRTVRNSVGYINCVVQYRNRDNVWKLLILLACLLLVLIVITIFIRVIAKPDLKKFKDSYNRLQQVLVRGRLKIFNYSLIREEQGIVIQEAIGEMAQAAILSGASAVIAGASFPVDYGKVNYRVMCKIEMQNWTKHPLLEPKCHINKGVLKSPPLAVNPGVKELFIAHKTGGAATGSYGTVSWLLPCKRKRAVVMWCCPFNFDYYKNRLAVGVSDHTEHKDWFKQMYYKSNGGGLRFVKGDYKNNVNNIKIEDGGYVIEGIMGSTHNTSATIVVRPVNPSEYASALKK